MGPLYPGNRTLRKESRGQSEPLPKILSPHLAADASARLRFAREARAAAAVSHEHVVAIHAVDIWKGLPFLVMPYICGVSLQQRLERDGIPKTEEILRIALQVARGLAAAHAQGLVHRDIKPANILLENGVERVKITDFGLARTADDASLTLIGMLAGTPAYMSPEQAQGMAIDGLSDLFSLGSVMYAMCVGHSPFRARTTLAVLRQVSDLRPRPIREINPEVPAWLASIISRLHEKKPSARYRTAGELAAVLEGRLSELSGSGSLSAEAVPAKSVRSRRKLLLAVAAASIAALSVLGAAEARGVTDITGFVATMLRIRTADGTLVVRIDDPETKVNIDGEMLVVSAPGFREVRLHPGPHRVKASRDGTPVLDELVSISRGDKKVVTVSRESSPFGIGERVTGGNAAPAAVGQGLPATEVTEDIDPAKFTVTGGGVTLSLARPTPIEPTQILKASRAGPAWVAVFSPDGKTLATGGADQIVRLWDLSNGEVRLELRGHVSDVRRACFVSNGKTLITSGLREDLRVWDVANGTRRPLDSRNLRRSGAHAVSPDGTTLATVDPDNVLSLWDVATWRQLLSFLPFAPPDPIAKAPGAPVLEINGLSFSPSGKLLAGSVKVLRSPSEGRAVVWDAETGALLSTTVNRGQSAGGVAFAPDGRSIAFSSFDGTITLWDVEAEAARPTLTSLWTYVEPIAISPDVALLAAGHSNGIVSLWDLGTGEPRAIFRGHLSEVHGVAFSPDGKTLATASSDSQVKIWDIAALRRNLKAFRPGF
jgi:eukaryotic-like serine/threonine-protein kinase